MKVLTYTSYKEHCDLCNEIHGSIAVNSCQIKLAQKDIILPWKVSIIVYKFGKRTSVENTKFISFNLLVGTYSIDDFNAKIKIAILQQRQDWEPPQIKDLKLVTPEDYLLMVDNPFFLCTWHTKQLPWKGYTNQIKATSWLIKNIPWYITSSKNFVTTLQANQQGQKWVGWAAIKLVDLYARF